MGSRAVADLHEVRKSYMTTFDQVLRTVDKRCREECIPMLGREKAEFLATLVEKARPALVVECGTAIGYSGLFLLQAICGIDKST